MATALAALAVAASPASPRNNTVDGGDVMTLRRASAFYGDSPDPGRLGLATEIRGVTFDIDSMTLTELRLLVARLVYTHPAIVSRASSHVLRILRNNSEDGDEPGSGDTRGRLGGKEQVRGGSGVEGGGIVMDDYGESDGDGDGNGGRSSPPPSPPLPEPLGPAEADDPDSENMAVDGMRGDGTPSGSNLTSPDAARNSRRATGASSGTDKGRTAKRGAGKQIWPSRKRNRNRPKSTRPTWEDRFDELCRVKELLGHTKPTREWVDQHPEYKSVNHWANNMRAYRTKIVAGKKPAKSTLTMERMEKLDSIGFEWAVPRLPQATWQDRFNQTLELKAILGHTKPTAQWLRDNPSWESWAGWAKRQRACEKSARAGRRSEGQGQFTEERKRQLDAVGFEWWK